MGQSCTIMAFRKRLSKRGYTNISIKQVRGWEAQWKKDTYKIRATEPLLTSKATRRFAATTFHDGGT